jgi:hypothetical protein
MSKHVINPEIIHKCHLSKSTNRSGIKKLLRVKNSLALQRKFRYIVYTTQHTKA